MAAPGLVLAETGDKVRVVSRMRPALASHFFLMSNSSQIWPRVANLPSRNDELGGVQAVVEVFFFPKGDHRGSGHRYLPWPSGAGFVGCCSA